MCPGSPTCRVFGSQLSLKNYGTSSAHQRSCQPVHHLWPGDCCWGNIARPSESGGCFATTTTTTTTTTRTTTNLVLEIFEWSSRSRARHYIRHQQPHHHVLEKLLHDWSQGATSLHTLHMDATPNGDRKDLASPRILQTMVSGIPLVLGLRTRMSDPSGSLCLCRL